jgi:hypothetical protein
MRTTLKIVLPLLVSAATVSLLFAAYQVQTEKHIVRDDLSHRAQILGESLQESVEPCSIAYRTQACNRSSKDSPSANT